MIPLLCLRKKNIVKISVFCYHCYVCQKKKKHFQNLDFLIQLLCLPRIITLPEFWFFDTTAMSAKKKKKNIAKISVFRYHCYVSQKKKHCPNFGFLIPLLCLPKKKPLPKCRFFDSTAICAKKNPLPNIRFFDSTIMSVKKETIGKISFFLYHCYVCQKHPLPKFRFLYTTAMSGKEKAFHKFWFLNTTAMSTKKTIAKNSVF